MRAFKGIRCASASASASRLERVVYAFSVFARLTTSSFQTRRSPERIYDDGRD